MHDLDTQTLRSFLAVAETGGFTHAARRVHRSQSAVSMQIRKLEEAVGGPVFERSARGVTLTRKGETLLGYARRLLELHDRALTEMHGASVEGTVRIGVMDDYATHVLPRIFAGFERRFASVILEVTTGFTADLLQELGESFDLVLATQPIGTETGRVLRTEDTCWAYAARLPLPDLGTVPLAVLARGNLFRNWATGALDAAGIPWRVVYSSTSIAAVESAAAAGIAVTVVKRSTARDDLRLIGPSEGLPPLPVSEIALHRAPGATAPAVHHLAAFLEDQLVRRS
jgi:DNA-binding transcriptional LysR family regulator